MPTRSSVHVALPREVMLAAMKLAKDDNRPLSQWVRVVILAEIERVKSGKENNS
jgi:hypothetical protein